MTTERETEIVEALRASKKYRYLCEEVTRRFAREALARHARPAEAIKAAKRKLHQVCGAFCDAFDERIVSEALDRFERGECDLAAVRAAVLPAHASTGERVGYLDEFFDGLFERIGVPKSMVDLGCGLNAFALPWDLFDDAFEYHGCDIDVRIVEGVNRLLGILGRRGGARAADIVQSAVGPAADVALLMKLLPTLEQQEKGIGERLLRELPARVAVVTFPSRTLGGKRVGMTGHYGAYMETIAGEAGKVYETFAVGAENVYVVYL